MTLTQPSAIVRDRTHEPGDRALAPGALAYCPAFVNTVDLKDRQDDLATAAALRDWLDRHGFLDPDLGRDAVAAPTETELDAVIALPEALCGCR